MSDAGEIEVDNPNDIYIDSEHIEEVLGIAGENIERERWL